MSGEDFFSQTPLEFEAESLAENDAALAAVLHLYLRSAYEPHTGCWQGRDEHDTLRRTCHAAEVLYRLNLDSHTATMTRDAGNWLINLPIRDRVLSSESNRSRLYPSRFKTLAYLRRFDDDLVRRDFLDLLSKEKGGMVRGVTESDVLTTCIVLDTLMTLERSGNRHEVCSDERYAQIIAALRQQFKQWRPAGSAARARPSESGEEDAPAARPRRRVAPSEIDNPRDLSYVLGLLLSVDRANVAPRQVAAVTTYLVSTVEQYDRARSADLGQVLYAALQLAEHCRGDEHVQQALIDLLAHVRSGYATPEWPRRWELSGHTVVLRLLLTTYGEGELARGITARFLREAERRRSVERGTLETELKAVIRERIAIEFGAVTELSGGFTGDQVFRVPFSYWYPLPGNDGNYRHQSSGVHESSVIIKRSTSDAFHTATENYRQLAPAVRRLFVRQPSETQVYKSGLSSAYYLTMEDLANLYTFESLLNEWDQRAMSDLHSRLLRSATELVCDASFTLFRETLGGRAGFPGTHIARLYLAPLEGKLTRAVTQVPWLKNALQGFHVSEQRFRGLDYYLGVIAKHATVLQPRALGLTHGDLHARNVMLNRMCTQLKLIDLDKLSWTGDYLADLANLLTDVCVYRRVPDQDHECALRSDEIVFITKSETAAAENAVRYPPLGRPATHALQQHMLEAIEAFAYEIDDPSWKPRLWLAAATALCVRASFQTRREPAAVLYGEAVRLLHELTRFLEYGYDLPSVLIPTTWSQPLALRGGGAAELPGWLATHDVLRQVHDGLRRLGLRVECDHTAVSYYAHEGRDGPLAKLVPPRREGIGRLLLPSALPRELPDTSLKVVRSSQVGDALGTIVILTELTAMRDVLPLVRLSMGSRVSVRAGRG